MINKILLEWYKNNKRDLPWRNTSDPYKIWVSEIILQQTRVNQGLEYYNKFTERFPDVKSLALADIDEVLFLWKGLGYYSRARNLHYSAQFIINTHRGVFPRTYNELLKLKGIGKYTAAAIASIAFNEDIPVIDGNVIRVYSRLFAIDNSYDSSEGRKIFEKTAVKYLVNEEPGDYNQAVMEFGALRCVPVNPGCNFCILNKFCKAFKSNCVENYPVRKKAIDKKTRFFNYLVIKYGNQAYVNKRNDNDIWRSLYEFPLIETKSEYTFDELNILKEFKKILENKEFTLVKTSSLIKHVLTHQVIIARFFILKISGPLKGYKILNTGELNNIAMPQLINRYIKDNILLS